MLPNFLCIGAQKCGTTSLWKILNAHPDVFLASPRETQFFHDDLQFADGAQRYEYRYFSQWSGQQAVGEKCPEYLYVPTVAERIQRTLGPDVKFIVTLRSPAQRAFSHYRHNLTALRESRTFAEAIAEEAEQLNAGRFVPVPLGYLGRGFYAQQLEAYFAHFDRNQFLIVDFDSDICSDQRSLTHRLCGFLNINRFFPTDLPFSEGRPRLDRLTVRLDEGSDDPTKHFVEVSQNSNRVSRVRRLLTRLVRRQPQTGEGVRRIYQPSKALVRFAKNFQQTNPSELILTREQEFEINRRYFRADIQALQTQVTFDVSKWLGHAVAPEANGRRAEAAA